MNSENSKTSKPNVLILKLTDKLDLKRGEKSIALSNLSIYYTWKNIKSTYNNNKFKVSASTWNDKFELSDGSYSVSTTQDYFEFILNKTWRKYWWTISTKFIRNFSNNSYLFKNIQPRI